MESERQPETVGVGRYWEDLETGARFQTIRRTITEADLVNFISATGMLEAIFIDATFDGAMAGRPVPAALTCAFIEGLQFQSFLQATGLALLDMQIAALKPVVVGDTIFGIIDVKDVRETSKGNRAVVKFGIEVRNARHELVMTYEATRLVAGRQTSAPAS